MQRIVLFAWVASCFLAAGSAHGQAPPAPPSPAPPTPTGHTVPGVIHDQPPTLAPVYPRMPAPPLFPPAADPRVIVFDPYFYPTHYNFRPLPYGYPPTTMGFFYDTYANPYYSQYYGPGEYYGF